MDFSRQEYWGGLPCPSPGHLPNPGIQPGSPTLPADSLPSEPPGKLASFSTHPETGASLHTKQHGPQSMVRRPAPSTWPLVPGTTFQAPSQIPCVTNWWSVHPSLRSTALHVLPANLLSAASAKSLQHCLTLRPHGQWATRLLCPWDSPGKNTGVGSQALLQGIFLTQGSNSRLMSPALAGEFFISATWEALSSPKLHINYSFHT